MLWARKAIWFVAIKNAANVNTRRTATKQREIFYRWTSCWKKGVEIADKHLTPEEVYIEKESRTSIQEQVHKAISQLTPRQQEIVKMIYFEGKTQEEVREYYGIAKSSMSGALQRILASLKIFFEEN
ncbi:MAG: sigma-70 family RNA polymerase sigma factor [Clostridia bacterium]|nr:sigma-70 family RNA polymerase sigma factor [Clostridia bacterium]